MVDMFCWYGLKYYVLYFTSCATGCWVPKHFICTKKGLYTITQKQITRNLQCTYICHNQSEYVIELKLHPSIKLQTNTVMQNDPTVAPTASPAAQSFPIFAVIVPVVVVMVVVAMVGFGGVFDISM
jgi:hypothetical protein